MMTVDQLETAVLQLPASERARLAERLIASLDEDAEVEREWRLEAERRDQELADGKIEGVSPDSALTSARNRIG
jgi:putative addiction module component (TIGR02574 family)